MSKSEDQVRQLLDIHQIQQLLLKYAIALDSRELDLMDRLFTKDAKIDLAGTGVFSVGDYKKMAGGVLPGLEATQHFCSPAVIRIEGDKAFTRCYFMAQHARNSLAPQPFIMVAGHYDDELVRADGEWLIAKRTGTATWVDGNPAVLGYPIPPGGLPWLESRNCPSWLLKR
jgi:hypothetical protein